MQFKKHQLTNHRTNSLKFSKVILVPTDFSAVAEKAIVHGLELARLLNYSLCLLHVYHTPAGTQFNKEDAGCQKIHQGLMDYKENGERKYGVKVDPVIREGNLFTVLNAVVTEIRPRLMVMGTHGKQGLQHLFGSHALRVVLDSPCPVMVVQDLSIENGYQRIVMPVNSDADHNQLAEWGLFFFKLFKSEIHLFESEEVNAEQKALVKGITAQIVSVFKEKKVSYLLHAEGSPKDFSNQLIDYSTAVGSDLIMTMTMPADDGSGYNFSDWNERLMFNPGGIPVLFIDRTESSWAR